MIVELPSIPYTVSASNNHRLIADLIDAEFDNAIQRCLQIIPQVPTYSSKLFGLLLDAVFEFS